MDGGKQPRILSVIIDNLVRRLTASAGDENPPLQLHPSPGGLIDDFPDDLTYEILLAHLKRQSLRTVVQYRCANRTLRDLIDNSIRSRQMCPDDVWLVSPFCNTDGPRVRMEVLDLTTGEILKPTLPVELQRRAADEYREGNTLRLRPVSGHFGSGLIMLEAFTSPAMETPRHRFVFNPLNESSVKFPVRYRSERGQHFDLAQRIFRFRNTSEYLAWVDTYPKTIEPHTHDWKTIHTANPLRFNGSVQLATACAGDDLSYMRYEEQERQNLIIEYDMTSERLCEKVTKGLPETLNSKYDHLFEHQGSVYLATVLSGPRREIDEIFIFKLNTASVETPEWNEESRVPSSMLAEVSGSYSPRIARKLRFMLVKGILLAISGRAGTPPSPRSRGNIVPSVLAYDFAQRKWEHDERTSMLSLDFQSFVFRPRLDIYA